MPNFSSSYKHRGPFEQVHLSGVNVDLVLSPLSMVFCYEKLFWLYCEKKNCSSDRDSFLKFKAEGREFAKNFRSLKYGFSKTSQKVRKKCSKGQRFICTEVTSYKIHTLEQFIQTVKGQSDFW